MRRVVLVLVATILAACTGPGGMPTRDGDAFVPQGSWQLVASDVAGPRVAILDDHPITLTIDGPEIRGRAACNSYGGMLTIIDGRVEISELSMTAMACEAQAMAAEAAFTSALAEVNSIQRAGERLVLSGPGVELQFEALSEPPTSELVDTTWVLETLFIGDVASSTVGAPATLELSSDGTFTGSTGCRTFTGEWLEDGHEIIAPAFGMGPEVCPPELQEQDEHVVTVIGDGFVPTIESSLLTLSDPGGVGLVYRAGE